MSLRVESLVAGVERRRQKVSEELAAKHRSKFGQFFTPPVVSSFLAGLLELPNEGPLSLLDPGAGVGSFSTAVVERVIRERPSVALTITAFEVDPELAPSLEASLMECVETAEACGVSVNYELRIQSFVEYSAGLFLESPKQFDACVMNPPYRKVNTSSPERVAAESLGLRASNLYTIFMGLAANLLTDRGQVSAIIPRSFANGPYHEPFRRYLLERVSLDFLHVYEQRGEVFADADVLQENVVIHATRSPQASSVRLSTSNGTHGAKVERLVPLAEVVTPGDPHAFIRIPLAERDTWIAECIARLPAALDDLDLAVSTGKVVDFRAKESLRANPSEGTVALIYPWHLSQGKVDWPKPGNKKPNALHRSTATERLLLPNEHYVLVKRFSAKEEPRRVVAAVLDGGKLPGDAVAIENHLNVFHRRQNGLPETLARGLSTYLNCTLVDDYVRTFSGHTQINATDLRQLRYPSIEQLLAIGGEIAELGWPSQADLDAVVARHVRAVKESFTKPAGLVA